MSGGTYTPKITCECSNPACRRTIPMRWATYRRLAQSGPVLHAWCQLQAARRKQRKWRQQAA